MFREILITGASGTFGNALLSEAAKRETPVMAPTHHEFDITNIDACREFAKGKTIDVIIHAAAIADWNVCHNDPELAFRVNSLGAINMAKIAKEHHARLILVSTDAVFPGKHRSSGYTEDDPPYSPVSVYGATKLMGEIGAAYIVKPSLLITRMGWLFGPSPNKDIKFVGAVLRQVAQGKTTLKAVYDKRGSPTYAVHAAQKLFDYARQELEGIRHTVNQGDATRLDIAREIVKLWCPAVGVEAASSDAFPSPIKRPDFSVLASIHEDARMPHWKVALREYYNQYPNLQDFVKYND